jgi:hypothetical protein
VLCHHRVTVSLFQIRCVCVIVKKVKYDCFHVKCPIYTSATVRVTRSGFHAARGDATAGVLPSLRPLGFNDERDRRRWGVRTATGSAVARSNGFSPRNRGAVAALLSVGKRALIRGDGFSCARLSFCVSEPSVRRDTDTTALWFMSLDSIAMSLVLD